MKHVDRCEIKSVNARNIIRVIDLSMNGVFMHFAGSGTIFYNCYFYLVIIYLTLHAQVL